MKKILVFISLAVLAACNSNDDSKSDAMEPGKDSTMPAMAPINSPYAIGYSSDFEMGDAKNAETLLAIWKDWDNGDLAAHKDMFADSVEMYFSDGSSMHSVRDSVLASAQNFRNTFASAVSSVDAVIPVNSKDKNENWALIWGKEIDTDKKGKVDSFNLHETWRFNKDGKVNLMFQYRQDLPKK